VRKQIAFFIAVVAIGFCFGARLARAQEESKEAAATQLAKTKQLQPYRLDFSVNEVEDDKKVNTRHYSMNLTGGETNEIKIGTRVPVPTGNPNGALVNTQYQYMDVGTRIWARLRERGDDWELEVNSDVSNLDVPREKPNGMLAPIVREIKINGDTLLVVGKPIIIGSVDDPNSKRQFQLEVTATKLR
jgi:hypothetical protein